MASPIVSRKIQYSDIDFRLKTKTNKDLYVKIDVEAVKQSIINIVTTNYGEKLFQPNFGANLRSILFEPIDQVTSLVIKNQIIEAIKNFEPRAEILGVRVQDLDYSNSIQIIIEFAVLNPQQEIASVGIILERLR